MSQLSQPARPSFNAFLSSALGREPLEVHQLAGDASSRRYFRVIADDDSWVLMAWEPFEDDGTYPFLSVRDHFAKHGVSVPKVLASSPAEGLVLLEDLGDLTLERKFWESQNQEVVIPLYKQAIDELIKIHFHATADRLAECTAFHMVFDIEKLLWEMNYARTHLLEGLCGIRLTAPQTQALDLAFARVCTLLHEEPKFIAHRDYHSRNVMIKLGKIRVIDFQDARLGPVQYDLVSLLRDSYVRLEEGVTRQLLDYYLDQVNELRRSSPTPVLPDPSRERFNRIYEFQTVQRCFKACGSFASFFNLRQDTRYLKYIPHTLQTVRKSMELFPELKPFLDLLEGHGVFSRKFDTP